MSGPEAGRSGVAVEGHDRRAAGGWNGRLVQVVVSERRRLGAGEGDSARNGGPQRGRIGGEIAPVLERRVGGRPPRRRRHRGRYPFFLEPRLYVVVVRLVPDLERKQALGSQRLVGGMRKRGRHRRRVDGEVQVQQHLQVVGLHELDQAGEPLVIELAHPRRRPHRGRVPVDGVGRLTADAQRHRGSRVRTHQGQRPLKEAPARLERREFGVFERDPHERRGDVSEARADGRADEGGRAAVRNHGARACAGRHRGLRAGRNRGQAHGSDRQRFEEPCSPHDRSQ